MRLLLLALISASPVLAQELPRPAVLAGSLAGHWTGALQYKDYQSGKLVQLPVKREVRALPDSATVISIAAFDDGPKAGTVYITSISLFDPASDKVRSASFRRKNEPEISLTQAVTKNATDSSHWTVVLLGDGTDGGKPAQLRTTETRDGSSFKSVEEYRAPGDPNALWNFRNQTVLTRDP